MDKDYKKYVWDTGIGLQDVDGIKPSEYLYEVAKNHIDGEIDINEAGDRIRSYYAQKEDRGVCDRTEEADLVSQRIAKILSEKAFHFSIAQYRSIHKSLFEGIYDDAGKIRSFNITKDEWVLRGDSVIYGNYVELEELLEYDLERERNFDYEGLSVDAAIKHIARFIADLWQIHAFSEGNTRTTAVFLIKYLDKLGFTVTNDAFKDNSLYFRNALVRANYSNYMKGIKETTEYLELFLRNMILGEQNVLKNRELIIVEQPEKNGLVRDKSAYDLNYQIISLMREDAGITLKEISDRTDKSLRTINNRVKELSEQGTIVREGSKKTGTWRVMD